MISFGLGDLSLALCPLRVVLAGVLFGGCPLTSIVIRLLLLEDWLPCGGLCLAALLGVLHKIPPGLDLLGVLVSSFPRLAISLSQLDGCSKGGLPVAALPGGYCWILPDLCPHDLASPVVVDHCSSPFIRSCGPFLLIW